MVEDAALLSPLLRCLEWRHILKLLAKSSTQREIASALNVSLCNVTRGAKVIKDKNSVITKYLRKDLK